MSATLATTTHLLVDEVADATMRSHVHPRLPTVCVSLSTRWGEIAFSGPPAALVSLFEAAAKAATDTGAELAARLAQEA